MDYYIKTLQQHQKYQGKLQTQSKLPLQTRDLKQMQRKHKGKVRKDQSTGSEVSKRLKR